MSGSSEINLKQSLRKIDFPLCAKEALNRIMDLICCRITSIKNMDLSLDLMAEFVFYEVDRRGHKRSQPLTPLLELQLIEVLYEYFNGITNESARNTLFLSLFSGTTAASRLASAWMQQLGNTSQNSCRLADSLIQDYFNFYNIHGIKLLPNISPQFAANFMTAITENYYQTSRRDFSFPPKVLLDTITFWIMGNCSLCTAAQIKQAILPPGAIAMEATTPIAGLLKWCILAPIYKQESSSYSDLHLALLNSITEVPRTLPPKAIYAQHLTAPINPILSYVNDLRNKQELKLDQILNEDSLQLALDRFAQAIQVVYSVNAVYGHLDDLFQQLKLLPFNKLMSIVISSYKKNKVIIL
ncbi:hypothetical protein JTB14_012786 [Gonioctena quinquepunctata]|nr:hypothetical protein JTB14_012786 [Gonioctena quinquepunctata]